MKRLIAAILCITLTLGMVGCGAPSSETTSSQEKVQEVEKLEFSEEETGLGIDFKSYDLPSYKITVLYGNFVESQGLEVKNALESLEDDFNVTFNFVEHSNNTENYIAAIESAVAAGTDGIIGACVRTAGCVAAAKDIPMVTQPSVSAELTKELEPYENYLGCISDDDYADGYAAGQALYDAGCRNVCIARYTAGTMETFDNRAQGFLDFVEEHPDMTLLADNQSKNEYANAISTFASAFPQMDGIYCVNLNDSVLQTMTTEDLVGNVKLAGINCSSQAREYLENGTLVFCTAGKYAITMASFAVLYNYLIDGTNVLDNPTKSLLRPGIHIKNVEEYDSYMKYASNDNVVYTTQEIAEMIHFFNETMNTENFKSISDKYSMEDLINRRK